MQSGALYLSPTILAALTPRELYELAQRPVDVNRHTDFSESEFAVRLSIAKKTVEHATLLRISSALDGKAEIVDKIDEDAANLAPPWGFYKDNDGCYRIVGYNKEEGMIYCFKTNNRTGFGFCDFYKTVMARMRVARLLVEDLPPDCKKAGLFIDPLGAHVMAHTIGEMAIEGYGTKEKHKSCCHCVIL